MDYISYNKLNNKYKFFNIIIFDPVTGQIVFDNNNKYLYSVIQDEESPMLIKVYHFGCDIKYYKKPLQLTFLKDVNYPFVSSNCSFSKIHYIPSSILAIPAPLINYKFIETNIISDEYNLFTNKSTKAAISFYDGLSNVKTTLVIECKEVTSLLTDKGKIVHKISEHLYYKNGHSPDIEKLYEIIRTLNDKEIAKDVAILIRDMKLKEILE
jgi:hypothetical protein